MNEPFDRGDINEASLAATERLRARLMSPPANTARTGPRNLLPWTITAVLLAFSVGIIANPWIEQTVRGNLPFMAAAAENDAGAAMAARLQALERRLPAAAAPPAPVVASERLAATEARVDSSTDQIERDARRIDQLTAQISQIASRLAVEEAREASLIAAMQSVSDRSEAILTVLLLRRAVDTGRPLDALLPGARRLFEPRYSDAVAALSEYSAAPVTRAGLARDLAGVVDAAQADARPDWWQALSRQVQAVFSGAASGSATALAQQAIARGDLEGAAARLRASAAARRDPAVRTWLAAAARLRAAEIALIDLEGAATAVTPVSASSAAAPSVPGL